MSSSVSRPLFTLVASTLVVIATGRMLRKLITQVRQRTGRGYATQSSSPSSSASNSSSASPSALTFHPASRMLKFVAPTVWHEFTPLAATSKAVNLGQGFPGWSPPGFVEKALSDAALETNYDYMVHQYARSAGWLPLVNKLGEIYSKQHQRTIDPLTQIVVTIGATEAICSTILGLINPGDEVVTFEPAFDIYLAQVEMAGGVLRTVPLRVATNERGEQYWTFDLEELKRAFSSKTRMLILNTPQNPTGKIFTHSELTAISSLVKQHSQCVVLSDEVYEHMCYERKHIPIATLPDMWDRTITVSSAGKTFSITGWKIGWVVGPEHLVRCTAISHQWVSFSTASVCQAAVAAALNEAEKPYEGFPTFYAWLNDFYRKKREIMMKYLSDAGITPVVPEGGFFIVGDTSRISLPARWLEDSKVTHDWALCRFLTVDIGVAAIPPSSFYCQENKHLAKNFARFAFCKPDDVLAEAGRRLLKLKEHTH